MHNGPRTMVRVAEDHWVVNCRLCRSSRKKLHFPTARECHEWWRTHEATERHQYQVSDDGKEERRKQQAFNRELVQAMQNWERNQVAK